MAWSDLLEQPHAFYQGMEAARVARSVLTYQNDDGGWPKNIDMTEPGRPRGTSTIDNGATVKPLRYMGLVARQRPLTDELARLCSEAYVRGVQGLLRLQYDNGGWPQDFSPRGYHAHVTYNDDTMINVLRLLRDVAGREVLPDADVALAGQARTAVARGVTCIVNTQIVENGIRTSWCAQHDGATLRPAKARAYEHPSKSGSESVGIVRFLMEIAEPPPPLIQAVAAAVRWFRKVRIEGRRLVPRPDGDRVVVEDLAAPALWARFYELGTDRPIFSGRDGIIRYSLAEIELERRAGYTWYVTTPAKPVLAYPDWARRHGVTDH